MVAFGSLIDFTPLLYTHTHTYTQEKEKQEKIEATTMGRQEGENKEDRAF